MDTNWLGTISSFTSTGLKQQYLPNNYHSIMLLWLFMLLRYLKSIFMFSFKEELQLYLLVVFPRIYQGLAVVLLGPKLST